MTVKVIFPRPPAKRKNTKQWCKGIPGREHVLAWVRDLRHRWDWYSFRCTACGKEMDSCYGSRYWPERKCKCGNVHND